MTSIVAWVIAAASTAFVISAQPGLAQPSSQSGDIPITVHTRQLGVQSAQQAAAALLRKAQDRGEVRVIIGLDVTMRDEDELSAAEEVGQRRALQSAQDAVARRSAIAANRVVKFETIPFVSAFVTPAQLQRLLNDSQVVSIQEDPPVLRSFLAQSVPLIKAKKLWQQGTTGAGQTVAVLDTGADYNHPMLKNKAVAGFCRSTTQGGGNPTTSTCPGGVSASNIKKSGRNCVGADGCDHGTHVSSIAVGENAALKGVARDAMLISGQVFSLCPTCSGGTTAFFTDVNSGLERVFQLRKSFPIASINMSLGTASVFNTACDIAFPATATIINLLFKKGIATVIASGNGSSNAGISAPACIEKAIAVGSTTKADAVSSFSNHHDLVDVMAPGSSITAGVPGGGLQSKSGTSMASPHVAGAFALLRQLRPDASVKQILKALKKGVSVTRKGVTKPRINMVKAADKLKDLVPASGATAALP